MSPADIMASDFRASGRQQEKNGRRVKGQCRAHICHASHTNVGPWGERPEGFLEKIVSSKEERMKTPRQTCACLCSRGAGSMDFLFLLGRKKRRVKHFAWRFSMPGSLLCSSAITLKSKLAIFGVSMDVQRAGEAPSGCRMSPAFPDSVVHIFFHLFAGRKRSGQ